MTSKKSAFEDLWPKVGRGFSQIPRAFFKYQHKLITKSGRPLNPTEVLVLLHLMQHYWKKGNHPRPRVKGLAERTARKPRTVRTALATLKKAGYIRSEPISTGGVHRYFLDGLLAALQRHHAEDPGRRQKEGA